MTHDSLPAVPDILAAATRFLRDDLLPRLSAGDAFNVRVTVNALDLVGREIAQRAVAEAAEQRRLEAALGRSGLLGELRDDLCDLIAADADALGNPEVREILRETTLDRLAIDQPGYSGYRAARG
ncbi:MULTISPECIES: DUF6285 domain-containing protein [unclassified Novosphingobium]|uniref:DUF6285 domain-containing protein n=1 Tax=unclassified Novosphingobium TaxID=2644732 RepID=UPI000F5E227A|nr:MULTISPECIES: DUF6285 domain-containing protein [unclassified Novosphingobium]RQW45642.1 hypothetical protein EH199_02960 [Novosphingobium sp. LASN5T]